MWRQLVCAAILGCGGGTASAPPPSSGSAAASPPPEVAGLTAARQRRDAICACQDKACVESLPPAPPQAAPTSAAGAREMLEVGQAALECLYRITGVPERCIAMYHTLSTVMDCKSVTDDEADQLAEQLERATSSWSSTDWSAASSEDRENLEHACEDVTTEVRAQFSSCR